MTGSSPFSVKSVYLAAALLFLFVAAPTMPSCVSAVKQPDESLKAGQSDELLDAKLKSTAEKSKARRSAPYVPDPEIRKNLNRSFLKTKSVAGRNVHLSVRQGQVILKGKVGSVAERNLVNSIVRTSPGIRKVESRLRIVPVKDHPWPKGDARGLGDVIYDKQIYDAVRRKLARTGRARLSQMKIEVYLGVVILSGPVADEETKEYIESTVKFIPKVRAVIDNTWVRENGDADTAG